MFGHQGELRTGDCVVAAAMLLVRGLPVPGISSRLGAAYVPKGPLLNWEDGNLRGRVLKDLADFARSKGAIFLKIDPDIPVGWGVPGEPETEEELLGTQVSQELTAGSWRFSQDQIQFRNTVLIDLSSSEEELMAKMKQKTRYNVRLAKRKGVTIRTGGEPDFDLLFNMYAETSIRDGFVIRDRDTYLLMWRTFLRAGMLEPLIAEVAGEPIAAVVIFRFGGGAWYINGMSRTAHREKMPNYLLQWEAIRRAKAAGCKTYDLWGAPDIFNELDPMWGVYRFKRGLGGQVIRHIGAWDLPLRSSLFRLYTQVLPRLLNVLRLRGLARTRAGFQELSSRIRT